jgi:hypothetical protein
LSGSIAMATQMVTVSSNTAVGRNTVSFIRVGKILRTRFFTATAFLPRRRSPCAKCRVMFTPRSSRERARLLIRRWHSRQRAEEPGRELASPVRGNLLV